VSTFDFVTYVMEQATRKINEQHERIEELQFENAKLREELQQSEDRFRNIPDEVWSKADLVEMTNKALEERDDANKQNAALRDAIEAMPTCRCEMSTDDQCALAAENAALRADAERYRYIKNSETMEVSEILQSFCVSITFDLDAAIDAARKEAQP